MEWDSTDAFCTLPIACSVYRSTMHAVHITTNYQLDSPGNSVDSMSSCRRGCLITPRLFLDLTPTYLQRKLFQSLELLCPWKNENCFSRCRTRLSTLSIFPSSRLLLFSTVSSTAESFWLRTPADTPNPITKIPIMTAVASNVETSSLGSFLLALAAEALQLKHDVDRTFLGACTRTEPSGPHTAQNYIGN